MAIMFKSVGSGLPSGAQQGNIIVYQDERPVWRDPFGTGNGYYTEVIETTLEQQNPPSLSPTVVLAEIRFPEPGFYDLTALVNCAITTPADEGDYVTGIYFLPYDAEGEPMERGSRAYSVLASSNPGSIRSGILSIPKSRVFIRSESEKIDLVFSHPMQGNTAEIMDVHCEVIATQVGLVP